MKTTAAKTNARIEYMLANRVPSKTINLPKSKRLYYKYDKALTIVLPGEPISDSRPRLNTQTDLFYNPHKAYLMKLFGEIYKRDKLLRTICVMTPHAFVIRNFVAPSKKILKAFAKNGKGMTEDVLCIKQKDNDNIEKVHFDVMQDIKYSVIIDDKLITHNFSSKFYSMKPRVEIEIQFPSEQTMKDNPEFDIYLELIKESAEYKKFHITKKYIFDISKTPYNKFPKVFFDTLGSLHIPAKQIKTILSTQYSAEDLRMLCVYCKIKPKTRVKNLEKLLDIINNDNYPISRQRTTDLKLHALKLE